MKRLFREDETFTEEACTIDTRVANLLRPVFEDAQERELPLREVALIVVGVATLLASELILIKQLAAYKERRAQREKIDNETK